jgi:hypothetical protein
MIHAFSDFDNQADFKAIIALSALFVSIVSVIFTFYALKIQRKHNRLSVKPIGDLFLGDYLDSKSVELYNNGVGPLLCKKIITKDKEGLIKDHIIDFLPDLEVKGHGKIYTKKGNFIIVAGEKVSLFSFEGDHNDNKFATVRDLIRSELSKLTLTIHYEDIYGKKMLPLIESLAWFGR